MMHSMRAMLWIGLCTVAAPSSASTTAAEEAPKPTVAVLYFDYPGTDPELDVLSKGLASMLITDMSANRDFRVVEREQIEAVIRELELSRSDLVDPKTAAKVGKIVSAQRMVTGRYWELGGQFRIDARMFDVETTVTLCGVGVTGKRDDFFDIEARVADELSTAMLSDGENCREPLPGTTLVPAKEGRTLEKLAVSTASEYSKALEAADDGKTEEAKAHLNKVLADEPEFTLAADELAKLLK